MAKTTVVKGVEISVAVRNRLAEAILQSYIDGRTPRIVLSSIEPDGRKVSKIAKALAKAGVLEDNGFPDEIATVTAAMTHLEIQMEIPRLVERYLEAGDYAKQRLEHQKAVLLADLTLGERYYALAGGSPDYQFVVGGSHLGDYGQEEGVPFVPPNYPDEETLKKAKIDWRGREVYVVDSALRETLTAANKAKRIKQLMEQNSDWALTEIAKASEEEAKAYRFDRHFMERGNEGQPPLNRETFDAIKNEAIAKAQAAVKRLALLNSLELKVEAVGGFGPVHSGLLAEIEEQVKNEFEETEN